MNVQIKFEENMRKHIVYTIVSQSLDIRDIVMIKWSVFCSFFWVLEFPYKIKFKMPFMSNASSNVMKQKSFEEKYL